MITHHWRNSAGEFFQAQYSSADQWEMLDKSGTFPEGVTICDTLEGLKATSEHFAKGNI